MLLTSVAFGVAAVTLARRKVLVQELPAVEGLARVDVVCLDKTGTLTEGEHRLRPDRAARRATRRVEEAACGALGADENRNATLNAIAEAFPPRRDLDANGGRAVLVRAQVERGDVRRPRHVGARSARDGAGPSGTTTSSGQADELAVDGLRVLLLARTDAPLEGDDLPDGLRPAALVLSRGAGAPGRAPTRCAYFPNRASALKVISGDNPRTVGGGRGASRAARCRQAVRRARPARGPRRARPRCSRQHSVFGRVTPHQKRAMVKALQTRGHVVGDDRRRRERRARAEGRRHRCRDGIGRTGDARGRAARAARRPVRHHARRRGRRAAGDRQHRAVANLFVTKTVYATLLAIAVGVVRLAVPVPAPPPHDRRAVSPSASRRSSSALAPNLRRYMPGFVDRVLRFAIPAGSSPQRPPSRRSRSRASTISRSPSNGPAPRSSWS